MFTLNYKSRLPIYEQIQSQVIEFIALGYLKPHHQLPAVRQLASDLGVNPNTVQKAYQELERMGYIYSQIGKGSFINEQQDVLQLTKNQKFDDLCELVTQMKGLGIALEDILDCCTSVFKKGDFTYDPTH
ncbi:MAG TPA: GntR family transcriptional regulator [Erysipelotrichaceae bacterium]|nr:GntR family transcriptional regulator [Erysipelotrichaceae bacterium]